MNGVTGNFTNLELDAKTRFAPKLKPEIKRVSGNPFYPNGFVGSPSTPTPSESETSKSSNTEFQRQVFESNLPVTQQEGTQKVGTMLNTLA